METLEEHFISDHKAIKIQYGKERKETPPKNRVGWFIDNKKFPTFSKYTKDILAEKCKNSALTPIICEEIMTEVCNLTFKKKLEVRPFNPIYWWNEKIASLRSKCQKFRRKIQRLKKTNEEFDEIKNELKTLKEVLVKEIKTSKRKNWEMIRKLEEDPWGQAYQIIRGRIKNPNKFANSSLTEDELFQTIYDLFPDHGE